MAGQRQCRAWDRGGAGGRAPVGRSPLCRAPACLWPRTDATCSGPPMLVRRRATAGSPVGLLTAKCRRDPLPAKCGGQAPGHGRRISDSSSCGSRHCRLGRRAPRMVAVAVARGRFPHLPAALPVPRYRPAAGGAEPGDGARHARARRARAAVRPACRQPEPGGCGGSDGA